MKKSSNISSYDNYNDNKKKEIIEQLYVNKKMSFIDIAKKYDTYPNKIRRDAKKFHIDIRNKSDAQKNALNTGKHKHPTKGKARTQDVKDKIGLGVYKTWKGMTEEEISKIKNNSRDRWNKMSDDKKSEIIKMANNAVRDSSKRGSKLEKFLLEKLIHDGYVISFHKEQILSNTKLQIDLFIPTLNIAIEVDGPSHFEPVWGEDSLKRNKGYDAKKTGLLAGKGISLIRIKQIKDFSKTRANIVYDNLIKAISKIKNDKETYIEIGDDNA